MTPYELIELIIEKYGTKDGIEVVNEIIWDIENNPRHYILKLTETIESIAEENEICPLCASDIIVAEHSESRGEYQGFESEEIIYQRMCSNSSCPYTVD